MLDISILGPSLFQSAQYSRLNRQDKTSQTNRSVNNLKKRVPILRHSPIHGVRDDGSGVHQIGVKQDPALAAVQLGDLHGVTHGVGPEEETVHVVDGDAFRTLEI